MIPFANDMLLLYCVGSNLKEMIDKVNSDLDNVFNYLCDNDLVVNIEKSKYMVICNRFENVDSGQDKIQISDIALENVDEIKYLGVVIDKNLSMHSHAHGVLNRIW